MTKRKRAVFKSHIGKERTFLNPRTGKRGVYSVVKDEVYFPALGKPDQVGSWGRYRFGAWLEENRAARGTHLISFPYWRNGRFAGQWSLRAEPEVVRALFRVVQRRGWLQKP